MQYKYTQANGFVVQGHIFVFIFVFFIFYYLYFSGFVDGWKFKKQHLFEIKIFCNNVKAFTVTFDQVNAFSV